MVYAETVTNVHGLPGMNIPADLHQEHLNRVVKEAIHGLGANKTETAVTQVGRALGTLSPVLAQFDKENCPCKFWTAPHSQS